MSSVNKSIFDEERCQKWERLSVVCIPSNWRNVSKCLEQMCCVLTGNPQTVIVLDSNGERSFSIWAIICCHK